MKTFHVPETGIAAQLGQQFDLNLERAKNEALRFLLEQAPMIELPDTVERLAHSVTPYAYVHPDTFMRVVGVIDLNSPWHTIGKSPTKWVHTDLMPKGRVIFSPNRIPGIKA